MRKIHYGFTLIELMVVVAILGVLASIAISVYRDYVPRTQVTRVYGELSGIKSASEEQINRGNLGFVAADVGYVASNLTTGVLGIAFNANGVGSISVTLGANANPSIAGTIISLVRDASGAWTCDVDESGAPAWRPVFMPEGCS